MRTGPHKSSTSITGADTNTATWKRCATHTWARASSKILAIQTPGLKWETTNGSGTNKAIKEVAKKVSGKATAMAKEASTMATVSAAVVQPQQVQQNPVVANMVEEKSARAANASARMVNSLAVTTLAMNSQTT